MKDFNHTVNVLVEAYLNDDLNHGTCESCAVGTIVGHARWGQLFITTSQPVSEYQHLLQTDGKKYSKAEIHNIDLSTKESAKALFVKANG